MGASLPRLLGALGILFAAGCGSELDRAWEEPSSSPPAAAGDDASRSTQTLRGSAGTAALSIRGERLRDAVEAADRRLLAPVQPHLYFLGWSWQSPRPDAVTLRVTGTQAVSILRVEILDDDGSLFGNGAAASFTYQMMPSTMQVVPGTPVDVQVQFAASTDTMQNAILRIATDAENTPVLEIGLTGKMALY